MSTAILPNAVVTVIAVNQPPMGAAGCSPTEAAMRALLFKEACILMEDHNDYIYSCVVRVGLPQHVIAYERACANVGAPPPQMHVPLAAGGQPSGSVTRMLRNLVLGAPIGGGPRTYPIRTTVTGEAAALCLVVHKAIV